MNELLEVGLFCSILLNWIEYLPFRSHFLTQTHTKKIKCQLTCEGFQSNCFLLHWQCELSLSSQRWQADSLFRFPFWSWWMKLERKGGRVLSPLNCKYCNSIRRLSAILSYVFIHITMKLQSRPAPTRSSEQEQFARADCENFYFLITTCQSGIVVPLCRCSILNLLSSSHPDWCSCSLTG